MVNRVLTDIINPSSWGVCQAISGNGYEELRFLPRWWVFCVLDYQLFFLNMKNKIILIIIFVLIFPLITKAQSGCCSWHGGVKSNGCGCNDGTSLSSTCSQYYTCKNTNSNYSDDVFNGYHGVNYQGECYSYEWYFSEYDKNVNKYLFSIDYLIEKGNVIEKLKTKDGDFLREKGMSSDVFISDYEYNIRYLTTILDDTDCFKPFEKLTEYTNSKISEYNTKINSMRYRIKKIFSIFK